MISVVIFVKFLFLITLPTSGTKYPGKCLISHYDTFCSCSQYTQNDFLRLLYLTFSFVQVALVSIALTSWLLGDRGKSLKHVYITRILTQCGKPWVGFD